MSCLFNSLSYFIHDNSYNIRQKICNYLEENKPIIEGLDTRFILNLENPNYIQDMRNISTWGGAIEIQAACNIWNAKIIVLDIRTPGKTEIEFIPLNTSNAGNLYRLEWSGGHYEPIR
uniref:OTU domain-containing protein n=1 Tax=viral metagenome TaxID=1070528 RepID=A0A6C0JXL8_9ZZZZ